MIKMNEEFDYSKLNGTNCYNAQGKEGDCGLKNGCKHVLELQNNWNELKKWLEEEIEHNVDGIKSYSGYQCKQTLDKMQELEQGKDESN